MQSVGVLGQDEEVHGRVEFEELTKQSRSSPRHCWNSNDTLSRYAPRSLSGSRAISCAIWTTFPTGAVAQMFGSAYVRGYVEHMDLQTISGRSRPVDSQT